MLPNLPISLIPVTISLVLGLALFRYAGAAEDSLAPLIEQAKADYRPVESSEVQQARADLEQAVTAFERYLVPGSRKGEAWKSYLLWSGVQSALAEPTAANLGALLDSLDRFRSGASGLELSPFRRTADAIERYVDLASIEATPDQRAAVAQQLDLLTKYVDRYEREPSARARYEIERRLDFLSGIGRAPELTSALRSRFGHPNIRVEVSENFLNRVVSEPANDVGPVRDCILGTTIRGTGYTTGSVSLSTIPSQDRAAILLHLNGTTLSETRGYNSPVVIRSSGTTHFTATKQVALEDSNFWNYPTQVHATTSIRTRSVQKQGGGLGSRLIASIGARQVAEKKPRADYIAARHAEDRIGNRFEERLLPRLQDARYEYLEQFRKPLEHRGAPPAAVAFSTTDRSLHFDALQAARGQLGADTPPPAAAQHAVGVRLHETGVANLAAAFVAGATLSQSSRDQESKLNVELPDRIQEAIDKAREEPDEEEANAEEYEFKPWSIRLRRQRPVTVEFADNRVKLRLHATRITAGNDTYDGWDIIVDYALRPQDGELMLVREGEIEVIPTAFDPAEGGGLTNQQVALRGNLAKELNRQSDAGRGFPKEIDFGKLDLPENMAEHGPLHVEEASSAGGWLSLGWRLP